jgi:spoIIIJ-associated protein
MAEQSHEFSGKTVDEAVADGLARLRLSRSDVSVEILSKGSRGIFGIGSEPARVRLTPVAKPQAPAPPRPAAQPAQPPVQPAPEPEAVMPPTGVVATGAVEIDTAGEQEEEPAAVEEQAAAVVSDDELAEMAADMLKEMVRLMGFEATVAASWQEPDEQEGDPYLLLDIEGEDLGALIGRRGETLASIQYLVRLMVNQRIRQWRNIVVDVEKYKERRVTQLTQLAHRMAGQVIETGRAVALEPMPANERRIVHLALRDHPHVYTQSSGEDDRRKVNIVPRDIA